MYRLDTAIDVNINCCVKMVQSNKICCIHNRMETIKFKGYGFVPRWLRYLIFQLFFLFLCVYYNFYFSANLLCKYVSTDSMKIENSGLNYIL